MRDKMKTVFVTAAIIVDQGKILVAQRMERDSQGLLWEFPGGKVREEEEPREALRRELMEELGIEVEVGAMVEVIYHVYPEYPILLLIYCCKIQKGTPKPLGCQDLRWVDREALKRLDMLPADDPVRNYLCIRSL